MTDNTYLCDPRIPIIKALVAFNSEPNGGKPDEYCRQAIADLLGINRQNIYKWETDGKLTVPSPHSYRLVFLRPALFKRYMRTSVIERFEKAA